MSFVLRCVHGPNKGKYFKAGDFEGIQWTDTADQAKIVSVQDAYGIIAAAVHCMSIAGATEEECRQFAHIAVKDMFNPGSLEMENLTLTGVRRAAEEPLEDPPFEINRQDSGYRSLWEWLARVSRPVKLKEILK